MMDQAVSGLDADDLEASKYSAGKGTRDGEAAFLYKLR
jgi:hypothetical protein